MPFGAKHFENDLGRASLQNALNLSAFFTQCQIFRPLEATFIFHISTLLLFSYLHISYWIAINAVHIFHVLLTILSFAFWVEDNAFKSICHDIPFSLLYYQFFDSVASNEIDWAHFVFFLSKLLIIIQ